MIAATFVRRTRFDPLHQAAQRAGLCGTGCRAGWPSWSARSESTSSSSDERASHTVELTQESMLAATGPCYQDLLRFVQKMCPAGVSTELVLSDRAGDAPGLAAQLSSLPGVSVRSLARGAAALGSLRFAGEIRRPAGQVVLVTHLTGTGSAEPASAALRVASAVGGAADAPGLRGACRRDLRGPARGGLVGSLGRTRVARAGRYRGVSRNPLQLRAPRRQCPPRGSQHLRHVRQRQPGARRRCTAGRRPRELGAPGVSLDLIRVVDDHGTPSQIRHFQHVLPGHDLLRVRRDRAALHDHERGGRRVLPEGHRRAAGGGRHARGGGARGLHGPGRAAQFARRHEPRRRRPRKGSAARSEEMERLKSSSRDADKETCRGRRRSSSSSRT